jgi:hypothetical protein
MRDLAWFKGDSVIAGRFSVVHRRRFGIPYPLDGKRFRLDPGAQSFPLASPAVSKPGIAKRFDEKSRIGFHVNLREVA